MKIDLPPTVLVSEQECEIESWGDPESDGVRWRTLISADRTPTEALTAGIVELDPGEANTFRPHRHEEPEIYHVLSGEGTLLAAGKKHPLGKGTTAFIPGNQEHAVTNDGSAPLRIFYVFPTGSFSDVEYEFLDP